MSFLADPRLVWTIATALAAAIVLPYLVLFRRRLAADRARLAEARALGIDRPVAQYPFVDARNCIGCGACVRACPEGDVLGVVGGLAVVINGLRCVGHGRCADACPVGAIEIGMGDVKGRPDVPVLTPENETTVPGVFVAGELSGLSLIRNAIEQGEAVMETIASRLRAAGPRGAEPGLTDVVVVGAGPAGLGAALAARQRGLSTLVVDQSEGLGGTILHFPRRKLVLTRPVVLPGGGALERDEYSKEDLLSILEGELSRRRLDVRHGERFEGLERAGDELHVRTTKAVHRARQVVLALGRRGTPRRLGVPGEELSKVMYQLRDAESYRGQRILVVGGGDSAIEAAVGLARQAGNRVTLSYRKKSFLRIKRKNQTAVESLAKAGRIRLAFESEVEGIEAQAAVLRFPDRSERVDNDWVFVMIGGDPPFDLLRRSGVRFGGDAAAPQTGAASLAGRAALAGLALVAALTGSAGAAQKSPHGPLAIACEECHTTAKWAPLARDIPFRHESTGFPLVGMHAVAACAECHQDPVFSRVATACADCHTDAHAGELGLACADCHDPRRWDARDDLYRAHDRTLFPLFGGHAQVDCDACHGGQPPAQFRETPMDCFSCHREDYLGATAPPHGGFSTDCRQCHVGIPEGWRASTFAHTPRFPLFGAHAAVDCVECHRSGYSGIGTDCYSCHRADYEQTRDPNHVAAGFPTSCGGCHGAAAWQPASFDHALSGFPLEGAHREIDCAECHSQGYTGTPADCWSCHRDDYQRTTDPNHAAADFPTTCQSCHDMSDWSNATFDHARAGFPLEGAHRNLACAECHQNGYAGTPAACASCHMDDFRGAGDPDHVAAGFPTVCSACHTTTAWQPATFDHSTSSFPLQGAHRSIPCADCHRNGYSGTPADCYSCHRQDYEGADDPNHVAAGFPTTCQSCHGPAAWSPASFNHQTSGFPLTGAHTSVACAQCHASGYSGTPTDCYSCHRSDYQGADDPNHSGFPTTCQSCHTTSGWEGAVFNHSTTAFPLTGAHTSVPCATCHTAGYEGTPTACFSCHQADFQGADDPDHTGFPTTCQNCHSTSAWEPASFNHNATSFPLTGAHTSVACASCHAAGYEGTPTACFSCHQSDYQGADDPDHSGFPTTCQNCHSTSAWEPASFDHSTTSFPLTGAHTSVPCAQCHATGYEGTPMECYACHRTDYQQANDPNHVAAGFPTTCATCHNTTSWEGATFDHDGQYFPIYSGEHRGKWTSCSQCHTSPTNYAVFSCITCHEHRQSEMDSEHQDVQGYVYSPTSCLTCHPDGIADD